MKTELVGALWGIHLSDDGTVVGEVIHISSTPNQGGPAENAFVYSELRSVDNGRTRYISWINYYDIEHASRLQPGRWKVVEPPQDCVRRIDWHPYGWGGPVLPSVAYVDQT